MKESSSRFIQSAKTKAKIVECANDLFAAQDYEKVKIVDICAAAEVSVGAFYHYFHSKEDIINESYNEFDIETEATMQNRTFASNVEAILFLITCQVIAISSKGYVFATCYFKNQLSTKEKYILNKDRYFYRELLEVVSQAIKTGEISFQNSQELTDLLLRVSRGGIYNWCLNSGNYDLIKQTNRDINYILDLAKIPGKTAIES